MKLPPFDRRALPSGATLSRWIAADGWAIRRMDWPQRAGVRPRGSLLFVGGRGDFIEKYLEAFDHWHRRGWSVASFDWRGQGDSRGTSAGGHLDSFDPLVSDCAALVAAWSAESPGPRVMIGHSMGGHLLLRMLAEHRPALDAAVLVAPMIGINASPVPPWLGRLAAHTLVRLGLRSKRAWRVNERPAPAGSSRQAYLTSCAARYADETWWRGQHPGFDLGPPTWGWMNAAFRSIARLTPAALRRVAIPLLILGSDRDRLVSPRAIRRAAQLLPDAELLMFPAAAHELLRESDPVRRVALARIDAFLDARLGHAR